MMINQAKHMQETFGRILKLMGGIPLMQPAGPENNYGLDKPGKGIHEVGTVSMGDDPKTSALNKWGQAHDCKNLFVTDGSVFTQQSEKNPTWTILALSMRTAEYMLDSARNRMFNYQKSRNEQKRYFKSDRHRHLVRSNAAGRLQRQSS